MSKVYTCLKTEDGVLERHTGWEPPGGSGVYRRSLWIWKNFTSRETPCYALVFLDGQNLFEGAPREVPYHWSAETRLAQWTKPLLVVGVPASARRYPEYIGWSCEPGHFSPSGKKHAHFLSHELLFYIKQRYPNAQMKGLIGASAGGVAALYTAWLFPKIFPGVACLSAGRHYFSELLLRFPGVPAPKVYVSCGDSGMDRDFLSESKKFAKALKARNGLKLKTRWHRGDHSERVWGRRLPELLGFFLEDG